MPIRDQRSSPTYQRSESSLASKFIQRNPIDKKLDYILVSPDDLKDLKALKLDAVSIDKPKILKFPDSGSEESYEAPSRYTHSRAAESYSGQSRNVPKYPSRPAPPLSVYSESLSNPSSYVGPGSAQGSLTPSPYSGVSTYSPPGNTYGNPKASSYSGYSGYRKPNQDPYTYYGGTRPSGYSVPLSYSGSPSYGIPKQNTYSAPISYGSNKPSSYYRPTSYVGSKPQSYSGPSYYGNTNPSTHSVPSSYGGPKQNTYSAPLTNGNSRPSSYADSYGNSKPTTYSGPSTYENVKPSGYSKPSTYESPKPSTYSTPSSYGRPKPEAYSEPPNYPSSGYGYSKSNPNSYTNSPSVSDAGKSYSPPSYHGSSGYSRPSSPEYDSSSENAYPDSKKYISRPQSYDYPEKTYTHDEYDTPKTVPHKSVYDEGSEYNPSKSYRKGYYDSSPPVKHVSYEDLPYSHKSAPHDTSYEHPESEYDDDSPKGPYSNGNKPISHDAYYHSSPQKKPYASYDKEPKHDSPHYSHSSKPSYGKKLYDANNSPKPEYDSNSHTHSYHSDLGQSYPKKHSYDTLKTSYGVSHEPSSYEESANGHAHRYPSSKVTYESPSSYRDTYPTPTSSITGDYNNGVRYRSSQYSPLAYHSPLTLEYGRRYPATYRTTRHTDSKTPPTSHLKIQDATPQDATYDKEDVSKPPSHYHYDDSVEIQDHHSAKTNYSPVRPAPEHDELEQPRYPPLPRYYINDKDQKYYDNSEPNSKDSTENYKSESSKTAANSYIYTPSQSRGKVEAQYPASTENHNYHYSDHSSEETDEPHVYTASPITYTKPRKSLSSENVYRTPDKSSFASPNKKGHVLKGKDFVENQPEYPRTTYKDPKSTGHFVHSYSYKSKVRPTENTSLPITSSSLSDLLPPKRVKGVVYRSRKSYPNMKPLRKHKGYLPYRAYYPKSVSATEYRSYESVPYETTQKNVTGDLTVYDSPKKKSIKLRIPRKKLITYSSIESDHSSSIGENSNHDAIPGEPGKDYPVLKEIPYNQFSCENRLPGFYADIENRCQVKILIAYKMSHGLSGTIFGTVQNRVSKTLQFNRIVLGLLHLYSKTVNFENYLKLKFRTNFTNRWRRRFKYSMTIISILPFFGAIRKINKRWRSKRIFAGTGRNVHFSNGRYSV